MGPLESMQQEGSKHAYPSDRDAHCLLKAMSFRHSAGVLVANRPISLSATDSWDCLRVRMGSASEVDACAWLLTLSSACRVAAEAVARGGLTLAFVYDTLLSSLEALVPFCGKALSDKDTSRPLAGAS